MLSKIDTPLPSPLRSADRVVVVGAGVGGLVSALLLAAAGCAVTVVDKAARTGGKLRQVEVGGAGVDSGPTVFTMRWVFEAIFEAVGERLADHLALTKADILGRHSFTDGSVFDLHADPRATEDAVGRLAGAAEARGYRAFAQRTEEVFATLNASFIEHGAPSPLGLTRAAGLSGLGALTRIQPFASLASIVAGHFRDPRLRQVFGRYATYCGSSPYQSPGPLMLIAHVERMGVWLVGGGMIRLAETLERLARARGVEFRLGAEVASIDVSQGRATGVSLAGGDRIEAEAVVFNGDPGALFSRLLGPSVARAVPRWAPKDRSLSALTLSMRGRAEGFALSRHTVFFSADYGAEFDDLFDRRKLPGDPTIYVCAEDRDASDGPVPEGPERLFLLVNAPAEGNATSLTPAEVAACESRAMERLARAGLTISAPPEARIVTGPATFAAMFPGSGGALYGRSSHGWASSFQRPGARTAIRGLYLAGGGVHPGPGVPMAALSGRNAAQAVTKDLASTATSRRTAMPGGISTRSAMTGGTR